MKLFSMIALSASIGGLAACQSDNPQYDGVSRFAGSSSSFDTGNHEIPEKDKPVPVPGVPTVPSPDFSADPGRG